MKKEVAQLKEQIIQKHTENKETLKYHISNGCEIVDIYGLNVDQMRTAINAKIDNGYKPVLSVGSLIIFLL